MIVFGALFFCAWRAMITCPKCHQQVADDARFCGNCATPIVAAGASEDVEAPDPFVGKCIDNKYYITERIAAGGMGVVYRATQKGVGQDVAIKRLHADFYQNPVIVKRFINEARSYGEITHPNAVKLHDLLNVNGQICIVMEYVKGRTLRDYIDNHYHFTNRQIIDICLQIADALGTVHRAGIIHRDLKSDNIMLVETVSRRFSVKILDFGIAKIRDGSDVSQTQSGLIVGSPEFMAPEQCFGQKIDHRVDIYAFGILMYLMICEQLPFCSDSGMALMQMQISKAIPQMVRPDHTEVLPGFVAIVNKCLEKDPDNRYNSFDDVIVDLTEIQEGRQTSIAVSAVYETVPEPAQDEKPAADASDAAPKEAKAKAKEADDDDDKDDEEDDGAFVLDDDDEPRHSLVFTIDASESELQLSDEDDSSDAKDEADSEAEADDEDDDNDGFSLGNIGDLDAPTDLSSVSNHESHTGRNILVALLILLAGGGGVLYYLHTSGRIDVEQIIGQITGRETKPEVIEPITAAPTAPETAPAESGNTAAAPVEPPVVDPTPEPELPKLPDPAPPSAVASRDNINRGIARATMAQAAKMLKDASFDDVMPLLNAVEAQKSILTETDIAQHAQLVDTKERYQTMVDQAKKAQRNMKCDTIRDLIEPLQDDEQAMRDLLSKQLQKCEYVEKSAPLTVD